MHSPVSGNFLGAEDIRRRKRAPRCVQGADRALAVAARADTREKCVDRGAVLPAISLTVGAQYLYDGTIHTIGEEPVEVGNLNQRFSSRTGGPEEKVHGGMTEFLLHTLPCPRKLSIRKNHKSILLEASSRRLVTSSHQRVY